MRCLIRADASAQIGTGHIARCLTLADALRALGAQVSFACVLLDGHLQARIEQAGYPLFGLEPQPGEDWQGEIARLSALLPAGQVFDWVIVDHYALDARWQQAARGFARQVAVIDDLGDRAQAADLLLNQNFNASSALYAALLPATARRLLGPRFALIRPAFARPPKPLAAHGRRVLVSFGGFDVAGMVLKTLQALAGLEGLQVTCVAGLQHVQREALQALCASRADWQLHDYLEDLPTHMAAADLFIGAGGGTTWERALLGLPSLCVCVADNQRANAEALARAGVHLYLGEAAQVTLAALREAVALLLGNAPLRQSFASHSRALVDGLGARRVAVALCGAGLQLRRAEARDAQLLFDGRNADAVRRWSLESQPLSWERHLLWLTATLHNPQRLLLIAEAGDGPVGMLRYDRLTAQRGRVSIYLFEGRFGLGWGRALLARGEQAVVAAWPELEVIEAQVLPDNQASLALFSAAGFSRGECLFERSLKDSQHEF
ncbi:UDP-2,4-diacetamido-2,4,6-trideoxy-beta-L-altropyranose hydrolase [Pseudomonas sp. SDI]|uniref:UDP-2,4-diacetamido-2,4, 6-trideoxy-beta-L-altropyranose hydrolase n=1 Tax=Pseudomonas sp. SDI TaxID=2170734 RepID=UPI000DE64F07|nr:UDP-2,4-diacetamido-2,4,6-trideoxy-beta-L-altropyranose hydrolase [Pseudomonas sp. SDI]PWB33564.1 UDP-2,4-diacetamido-2,4,6-trideoxy-beta-L-altropyranose hydrolase [Pseudomonas sp. SDI]